MKKFVFLILLGVIGIPAASAEISIENDQHYIGTDGALYIVGEIYNGYEAPLNQVNVLVSLFSSDNQKIESIKSQSFVNTIMPGMKSPFETVVMGGNVNQFETYSVDVDYQISEPKKQVIDIVESKLTRNSLEDIVISGTVANKGEITAARTKFH